MYGKFIFYELQFGSFLKPLTHSFTPQPCPHTQHTSFPPFSSLLFSEFTHAEVYKLYISIKVAISGETFKQSSTYHLFYVQLDFSASYRYGS